MIAPNSNISSKLFNINITSPSKVNNGGADNLKFADTVKTAGKLIGEVDKTQQASDMSIKDLLAGNEDITSVVSAAAKADMSFKLLVGVRNKLIEAYKQTMNMQI